MILLPLMHTTATGQQYSVWQIGLSVVGGICAAIIVLAILAMISTVILKRQQYKEHHIPQHILRKALEDMVQHDIETNYQNTKPLTAFLPRHDRDLEMDKKQLAYVATVYEELVHDAEKHIAQRRAVDRMFERLEERRREYLEQLETQHASQKSLY